MRLRAAHVRRPRHGSGAGVFAEWPEARVEHFEITDPDTLQPVERWSGSVLIAGAMWLGSTRLIDNVRWPG